MLRILLFTIGILFFLSPQVISANEDWVINDFKSDITVEKSGVVKVIETLEVDFGALVKHGIYRDIPFIYDSGSEKTYTEIDVTSIRQNSKKAKYTTSKSDGFLRLKIGDADKTITGRNTYEISYLARGVLRGFSDYDELYWNVTGNNWPVEIRNVMANITVPDESLLKIDCFEGYAGSTAECKILGESRSSAKFGNNGVLSEAQGLTVVAGYKKGIVPLLKVDRPKSFWERLIDWPSLTTIGTILLFGIGTTLYLWNKNGRDYWFGQNIFGKKNELGKVKPIGAHESTVVEYTPPEKLRPAEIGVLMDERADTLDVVSTIIDLASRGYLTMTEVPKKWLFGKVDYLLSKKEKDSTVLLNYEKMLLSELFKSGDSVKVSDLKNTFYTALKKIKEELYHEVVRKNLFPSDPEKIRSKYVTIAIFLIFGGIFTVGYTIGFDNVFLADLCIGILVSGIVLLGFARHMPRRTAFGREVYRRIKGYRLFIDKAEKHRQIFFEKKNLFNDVLPYAIVFGLTAKFANSMRDMGLKVTNPSWYTGTNTFNSHVFASSMSDFSSSMSSAIASTPSSSGGFSSGGSSGGGFSGGGGGSW